MPSKTIEEFLKTARPEQLAELKKDGQDLQRNGVAVKEEFQTPAPKNKQVRTAEPADQMPKRENAMDQAMAAETNAQAPSQDKQKDQEHER